MATHTQRSTDILIWLSVSCSTGQCLTTSYNLLCCRWWYMAVKRWLCWRLTVSQFSHSRKVVSWAWNGTTESLTLQANKRENKVARSTIHHCWQTSFSIWLHLPSTNRQTCFTSSRAISCCSNEKLILLQAGSISLHWVVHGQHGSKKIQENTGLFIGAAQLLSIDHF